MSENINALKQSGKNFKTEALGDIADSREPLFAVLEKMYSSIPENVQR